MELSYVAGFAILAACFYRSFYQLFKKYGQLLCGINYYYRG